MRRAVLLLTMMFTLLLVGGIGTVVAEPQKNQIRVPVVCDNGEDYTLVFNAMSKTGQVLGSTSNVVVKRGNVTYYDPDTGDLLGGDTFGGRGSKNGLQGDLINCTGTITVELFGLGEVRAVFEFQAFVTPRSD